MPRTRDRFIHNPLANLIAPSIAKKEVIKNNYVHDKLDVSDIHGTKGDLYGLHKIIVGRDNLDTTDIAKTKPKILKQNRITNIPDHQIDPSDVNEKHKNKKFVTNRLTDPQNPVYRLETVSRRHVVEYGQIDGNAPKLSVSPSTRRHTNRLNDISGSIPKDLGSIPVYIRNQHSSLPPKTSMLQAIPEDGDFIDNSH